MAHKIANVAPLDNYKIKVVFVDGEVKLYNAAGLISIFEELKDIDLFKRAKVDVDGYGIIWCRDIYISSESVYYD